MRHFLLLLTILTIVGCDSSKKRLITAKEDQTIEVTSNKKHTTRGVELEKYIFFNGKMSVGHFLDDLPFGKFITYDSNNIARSIEWYHQKNKPFYVSKYENFLLEEYSSFDKTLVNADLIKLPEIKCIRHNKDILIEVIVSDYPMEFMTEKIFYYPSTELQKRDPNILNNTWNITLLNAEELDSLKLSLQYLDDKRLLVKEFENIKIEIPKSEKKMN